MFTQIPVYILCAMPSNQVCQCLRQFGMPFFQLCRRRTETLQRSLTQMQGIGFRRFFRFRDQPDRNRAYRSIKPCQLRQYRRCNHFQARCRHIVCRQKDKPAVFDTCSGFGTSLTETERIEASSPANCGNTDGAIIFKRDAAILFAAKRTSLPSSIHAV